MYPKLPHSSQSYVGYEGMWGRYTLKLRNATLHNVNPSLIYQNLREQHVLFGSPLLLSSFPLIYHGHGR